MRVVLFMVLGKSLNSSVNNLQGKCCDSSQGQAVEAAKLALGNVSMLATLALCCQTFTRRSLGKINNAKKKTIHRTWPNVSTY